MRLGCATGYLKSTVCCLANVKLSPAIVVFLRLRDLGLPSLGCESGRLGFIVQIENPGLLDKPVAVAK